MCKLSLSDPSNLDIERRGEGSVGSFSLFSIRMCVLTHKAVLLNKKVRVNQGQQIRWRNYTDQKTKESGKNTTPPISLF